MLQRIITKVRHRLTIRSSASAINTLKWVTFSCVVFTLLTITYVDPTIRSAISKSNLVNQKPQFTELYFTDLASFASHKTLQFTVKSSEPKQIAYRYEVSQIKSDSQKTMLSKGEITLKPGQAMTVSEGPYEVDSNERSQIIVSVYFNRDDSFQNSHTSQSISHWLGKEQ